jgi:hypothetical protein
MAPPVTTGTTPARVRQAKSLADLRLAGGDKVTANLPAPAIANLRAIMSRLEGELGSGPERTRTEAIIFALSVAADVLSGERKTAAAKSPRRRQAP